jgi:methionine-S-sulfoxide reductase
MKSFFNKIGALLLMTLSTNAQAGEAKAVFAGGCFWCMESEFEHVEGILSAVSGYTGGDAGDANYAAVSSHRTQHVEAVEITYDPAKVDYAKLLDIYWSNIDPTDAGGQMYDRGPQYATVIYYQNDHEKELAQASKIAVAKKLGVPIATRIEAAQPFYPAEEGHQNYYKTNAAHYQSYVQGSGRKEKLRRIWDK